MPGAFRSIRAPGLSALPIQPKLNRAHPLALKMTSCVIPIAPGTIFDLVRPRVLTQVGSPGVGKYGQMVGGTTRGQFSTASTSDLDWTSGHFTCACWTHLDTFPSADFPGAFGRSHYLAEGDNRGWSIGWRGPEGGPAFSIFNNGTSGGYGHTISDSSTIGDVMLVGQSNGVDQINLWVNLAKYDVSGGDFAPASNTAGTAYVFGDQRTTFYTHTYIACTWNRLLRDEEIRQFYYDPFAITRSDAWRPNTVMLGYNPPIVPVQSGVGSAAGVGAANATGITIKGAVASAAGVGAASALSFYFQSTASILKPDADASAGSWENEALGTPLYPSIDENAPSDADYITSSFSPSPPDVCKIRLSNPTGPGGGIQQPMSVFYRFGKTSPSGSLSLQVRLMQGTTAIATWTHSNISSTLQTVEQVLTGPQFAAITDPTDLFLEFSASSP